jgi:hypothetical protein
MANPTAFGRATRVRHCVDQLMAHFKIREQWPVEVAATLSQIGCFALPPATLDKLYRGDVLDDSEHEMVKRMHTVAEKCLSRIPALMPYAKSCTSIIATTERVRNARTANSTKNFPEALAR